MSAIFQEIKDAEAEAQKEVSVAISSLQKLKASAVQKAKKILLDSKKDADNSLSSKMAILDKELAEKKEEEFLSIRSEVESFSSKTKSYVEKGVSFLFPRLA